jgi:hypothetical protein
MFVGQLHTTYQNLSQAFNGGISYGDGTNTENINGSWASVTTPGLGTNFTVTHGLNRIPVGVHVTQKNVFCDVLMVSSTKTTVTLQASAAGAVIRLFVFGLLLCLLPLISSAQGFAVVDVAWKSTTATGNSGLSGTVLQPIPSAVISVCPGSTLPSSGVVCSPVSALLYSNIGLTSSISNPTNADVNGNYVFFVTPGSSYVVSISGTGVITYSYVLTAPLVSSGGSSFSSVTSSTANPATSGFIRQASTDQICWRNNANSANICINKNSADNLFFGANQFAYLNATQTWPNQQTFSLGLVAPTIGPSSAQQHTLPAVTSDTVALLTAAQTLTNKTLTTPVVNGTTTGTGVQGTDAKILSSGTIAGTASTLCTDASGGATTSGCSAGISETTLFQNGLAVTAGGAQLFTLITPSVNTIYRVYVQGSTSLVGITCAPQASYTAEITWTDAAGNGNLLFSSPTTTTSVLSNGALQPANTTVYVKGGTSVQVGINVSTPAAGCGTNPQVSVAAEALP